MTYIRLSSPDRSCSFSAAEKNEVVFGPIVWLQQSSKGTVAKSQDCEDNGHGHLSHDIELQPDCRGYFFYDDVFYTTLTVFNSGGSFHGLEAEFFEHDKSILRDLIAGNPDGTMFWTPAGKWGVPHLCAPRRFSVREADEFLTSPGSPTSVRWFNLQGVSAPPVQSASVPVPVLPLHTAPLDQSVVLQVKSGDRTLITSGLRCTQAKTWLLTDTAVGIMHVTGWLPHPAPHPKADHT